MITSLIVAAAANEVIGAGGELPWHLPADLRRFRQLTAGHAVVVGRVTHESILARLGRPLPGRTSVVISSRPPADAAARAGGDHPDVHWAGSVVTALAAAHAREAAAREADAASEPGAGQGTADAAAAAERAREVFVLGGASVYGQALAHVERVYLTRLHCDADGDARMPDGWLDAFTLAAREDHPASPGGDSPGYSFLDYERPGRPR